MEKWTNSVMFPTDNFVLRVVEAGFGPSKSSGNPMITLTPEIVSPASIEVAGIEYNIQGLKVSPYYATTQTLPSASVTEEEAEEKSKYNDTRVFNSTNPEKPSLYQLFEIDATGVDKNNPDVSQFKGKLFHARLKSKVNEKTKSPTAEQLKKGQKVGDVIKNPKTGKPEVTFYPEIDKIYGIAEGTVSGAL